MVPTADWRRTRSSSRDTNGGCPSNERVPVAGRSNITASSTPYSPMIEPEAPGRRCQWMKPQTEGVAGKSGGDVENQEGRNADQSFDHWTVMHSAIMLTVMCRTWTWRNVAVNRRHDSPSATSGANSAPQ